MIKEVICLDIPNPVNSVINATEIITLTNGIHCIGNYCFKLKRHCYQYLAFKQLIKGFERQRNNLKKIQVEQLKLNMKNLILQNEIDKVDSDLKRLRRCLGNLIKYETVRRTSKDNSNTGNNNSNTISFITEDFNQAFFNYFNGENSNDNKKPHKFFCHHKLCPICGPYRSYKMGLNIFNKMMNSFTKEMYGVLTVSPKNPKIEELQSFVTKLKHSSKNVFKPRCRQLNELIDGSVRRMEASYSGDMKTSKGTRFHPHLHLVLCFTRTITEPEVKELFDLLGQRFLHYMALESSEMCLSIYEANPVNFQGTSDYVTKFTNQKNLADNISTNMRTEDFLVYIQVYSNLREIDHSGNLRGQKEDTPSQEIKTLYNSIKSNPNYKSKPLYKLCSTVKVK